MEFPKDPVEFARILQDKEAILDEIAIKLKTTRESLLETLKKELDRLDEMKKTIDELVDTMLG